MPIDGDIFVNVDLSAGRVQRASVRSERPQIAARLLTGRTPSAASDLVGTLFAICARAQSIAAHAATDAAQGRAPDVQSQARRERSLAAEIVQEHLWRLLFDWPRLAQQDAQSAALAKARALGADALGEWVSRHVLAENAGRFLERDSLDSLQAWTRDARTPAAALVAHLLERHASVGASRVPLLESGSDTLALALAEALATEPDFDARPHRAGQARETGVLARNASHPLVAQAIDSWGRGVGARVVSRLVDLARAVRALEGNAESNCGAVPAGAGAGIGWVETARGLLMHFARVEGGRVSGYRIVAPTEWNFHPDGAMASGAMTVAGASDAEAEEQLRWLVASLDPCTGWHLEAGHA